MYGRRDFRLSLGYFGLELLFFTGLICCGEVPKVTYEEYFKSGVEAYLENNFESCIEDLENALESHRSFITKQSACRKKCNKDSMLLKEERHFQDGNPMGNFYEWIVGNALCLMQCENELLEGGQTSMASQQTEEDFTNRVPYDYLQLCYYKLGRKQIAASCAYTFLVHNPEHENMKNNLKFYLGLPEVALNDLKYLDAKKYQELFFQGSKAYNLGENSKLVELMEAGLLAYYEEEENCRALCEGTPSSSPKTSFIISIAHQYTYTLRCKIHCPYQLSLGHGEVQGDLLPSFFHYLQFAYYHLGNLAKACEAVASYLHLRPDDTIMIENKVFYSGLADVKKDWFKPREEVVKYQSTYENDWKLLKHIDDSFNFKKENIEPIETKPTEVMRGPARELDFKWEDRYKEEGIEIVKKEKELMGEKRFMADGLASGSECSKLLNLAMKGVEPGDGYRGNSHPHTKHEKFSGLTIGRAVNMVNEGTLDPFGMKLFLDLSDKSKRLLEDYFNLTTDLFFTYTHLACRDSLYDKKATEYDLSHNVHADNCLFHGGKECHNSSTLFMRDYSAILYLNQDFQGGDFFFAENLTTAQFVIRPQCGRMIGFSSGFENLHGVRAVESGRRCALAMWFTLDPRHEERVRTLANQAVKDRLESQRDETLKTDSLRIEAKAGLSLQPPSHIEL